MDVNASRIRVSSTIGVYSRTSILGRRGREPLTVLRRPVAQRWRLPGHGPSSGDFRHICAPGVDRSTENECAAPPFVRVGERQRTYLRKGASLACAHRQMCSSKPRDVTASPESGYIDHSSHPLA